MTEKVCQINRHEQFPWYENIEKTLEQIHRYVRTGKRRTVSEAAPYVVAATHL